MNALSRLIESRNLVPGDRLPPEREITEALGVGRSTVREAIRQLQALGAVETRQGSGSRLVRPVSPATVHMPLSFAPASLREGLLQTLDVRRGLEVEASALAAMRAMPVDLERMEAKLVEMERVHMEKGTAGREDLAFHLSIYDATGNPLFHQLLEQMREAFEGFFAEPFDRPDFARRSFPFHRKLFEAIAAGDAVLAKANTVAILDIVAEDIVTMAR
ncbi:FadR/GntR family transcriptional regulator [Aureimonas leprariae]|uniref:FadR family transcriptional regulator n=1 Tax=Plantimonas leprariae TaxID=2615207 RepID=A0A7V7PTF6_9HYPH|nr:FadR/GntR family transcriptional regulator [Aureimonas leprariae]KAB0682985.1 FadR family transcriptional regulator [Aureimonas leprariae]